MFFVGSIPFLSPDTAPVLDFGNFYSGVEGPEVIDTTADILYVGGNASSPSAQPFLTVLDVSDQETAITLLGSVTAGSSDFDLFGLAKKGDVVFGSKGINSGGAHTNLVTSFDVTLPSAPSILGRMNVPAIQHGGPCTLDAANNVLYVLAEPPSFGNQRLYAIDVSTPSSMSVISFLSLGVRNLGHCVYHSGSVYVSSYTSGTPKRIFRVNVSTPSSMSIATTLSSSAAYGPLCLRGSQLIVMDSTTSRTVVYALPALTVDATYTWAGNGPAMIGNILIYVYGTTVNARNMATGGTLVATITDSRIRGDALQPAAGAGYYYGTRISPSKYIWSVSVT